MAYHLEVVDPRIKNYMNLKFAKIKISGNSCIPGKAQFQKTVNYYDTVFNSHSLRSLWT